MFVCLGEIIGQTIILFLSCLAGRNSWCSDLFRRKQCLLLVFLPLQVFVVTSILIPGSI